MIYVFGECELDTQRHMLRRAGQGIRARRKVFQALTYLLAHHDRAVSKQELCEQIWPKQFISDAALESTIKGVRQAIGDSGRGQQFIQTVYGFGYRFIAAVEEYPDTPSGTKDEAVFSARDPGSAHSRSIHDMAVVPPRPGAAGDDAASWRMYATTEERSPPRDPIASAAEWKMVTILCCGLAEAPARVMPEEPDVRYHQWRELHLLA
jgi:DNA-binding winged helix-turn-helix (wHTH) protein